jgi:hypothetical protein
VKRTPPPCPACGSSATLPFEDGAEQANGAQLVEAVLVTLLFFLSLLAILLAFLLSRASLPAAGLLLLAFILFWRRRRGGGRRQRQRPRSYVCLDCSRSFKAH